MKKYPLIAINLSTISPDQAWFWTKSWQKNERKAQEEIDQGNTYQFENVDEALKFMHQADTANNSED
jgi:hypothetical protein